MATNVKIATILESKTNQPTERESTMRMNYSDIKSDIYDHLDQLKESAYPEDLLNELADSAVPIYYNEIISDWQEMPSEYNDNWKTEGYDGETIFELMTYDLAIYYHDQYHKVYSEVMHDQEEEAA